MQAKRGFTLVEILIVVVILGILAAIVIPQFTQASTEAKLNSLCSNLQTLRSQIELYKVQHNDVPPGNTVAADGTVSEAIASFGDQMAFCSGLDGADNGTKERDSTYKFGPYLERIPDNPFNGFNGVAAASGDTVGWVYDPNTGEIHAAADSTAETAAHEAL
jgi:general secretion pathway protein G